MECIILCGIIYTFKLSLKVLIISTLMLLLEVNFWPGRYTDP